jgi:TPR repeat protein
MFNRPVAEIRKAAESGDPLAQIVLGILYSDGKAGLPSDESEAKRWWEKASDQGYARAMALLGKCLVDDRETTDAEKQRGLDLLTKAAAVEDYMGLQSLAFVLVKGIENEEGKTIIAKDWNRANSLFVAAMRQVSYIDLQRNIDEMARAYRDVARACESGYALRKDELKRVDPRYRPDADHLPLVYLAARYGHEVLGDWLDTGIDPNFSVPPENLTLLHGAAKSNYPMSERTRGN